MSLKSETKKGEHTIWIIMGTKHVMSNTSVTKSLNIPRISADTISTVYNTGNIIEVITSSQPDNKIYQYKKLDKDRFINVETGEIGFYKHTSGKTSSANLSKTFTNLRRIINLNFTGDHTERFVTLTYGMYMDDTTQVRKHFKQFVSSLRYHLPIEYVACLEPQQSGSWHIHILLKRFDEKPLTLSQETMNHLWKHGISFVEPLPFADNFGAYFTARLIDIDELEEGHSLQGQQKSIVKGQRVKFYPSGCHIYRCSRGIKRPIPQRLSYREAMQMVKSYKPCYQTKRNILIKNADGTERTVNEIFYQQFQKLEGGNHFEENNAD